MSKWLIGATIALWLVLSWLWQPAFFIGIAVLSVVLVCTWKTDSPS